jgi:hypothetical protein
MYFFRILCRLGAITGVVAPMVGCQSLSRTSVKQVNTADTRAIPAASIQHPLTLAELTGEDLGMGGGFLVAASPEKIRGRQRQQAVAASNAAEASPSRLEQVHESTTADLNNDGFVTLDEVLAMTRAGMSDDEVIDRLRKTGYIFRVTPQQERYLTDRRAPQKVVDALRELSGGSHAPQ